MNGGLNIVFMGTPDFAVPTLKALGESHHSVRLVVTQPDRPKGRGRKPVPPPVKTAAARLGCTVVQPGTVRTEAFFDLISAHKPDLLAVVAFGHILPDTLLNIPRLGAVNAHASLLPKYRGAAPIQWAIIKGETHTGVTTIQMDTGMDTGDILLTQNIGIEKTDTAGILHNRLANLSAELMLDTMDRLALGQIQGVPQDHSQATEAPILTKNTGHIAWRQPAIHIERFIRGVTPWPGAYTFHGEKRLKLYSSLPIDMDVGHHSPGTVLRGFPDELRVSTGHHALSILEIQGASGKRLSIGDFLRGYRLPPGSLLS